jgi:hypothetical protein
MIASTGSEHKSRNHAQEGDVRLLASGDAGVVAIGNTTQERPILLTSNETNVNRSRTPSNNMTPTVG